MLLGREFNQNTIVRLLLRILFSHLKMCCSWNSSLNSWTLFAQDVTRCGPGEPGWMTQPGKVTENRGAVLNYLLWYPRLGPRWPGPSVTWWSIPWRCHRAVYDTSKVACLAALHSPSASLNGPTWLGASAVPSQHPQPLLRCTFCSLSYPTLFHSRPLRLLVTLGLDSSPRYISILLSEAAFST